MRLQAFMSMAGTAGRKYSTGNGRQEKRKQEWLFQGSGKKNPSTSTEEFQEVKVRAWSLLGLYRRRLQQVEVTQNAPINQPIYVQSTTGLCNVLGDRKQRNGLVDCRKESLRRWKQIWWWNSCNWSIPKLHRLCWTSGWWVTRSGTSLFGMTRLGLGLVHESSTVN